MDTNTENIIKKVIKRAIDLYLDENTILNIDNESYQNDFLKNSFGVFIEISDNEGNTNALGNIQSDALLLNNIVYVLINIIKNLRETYMEKLKNNELNIRIWIVDNYINLKGKAENEKIYNVSINKPAILINKDEISTYCYLPSVWETESDTTFILENLSINAGLDKDAWKDNGIDLITFKPLLVTL